MRRLWQGIISAAFSFVLVGVVVPAAIDAYRASLGRFFEVPTPIELYGTFLIFGAAFAVATFIQTTSEKWQYRWLAAKLADTLIGLAFFYYLFITLAAGSLGSAASRVEDGGLLDLVYFAIALSYAYLLLDFAGARRVHMAEARTSTL